MRIGFLFPPAFFLVLGCVGALGAAETALVPADLVGTWRGSMTLSVDGDAAPSRSREPDAELVIFNDSLQGRFTRIHGPEAGKSFPFFGTIEGDELVARWKGGRWMKLKERRKGSDRHLEGRCDFGRLSGFVSFKLQP